MTMGPMTQKKEAEDDDCQGWSFHGRESVFVCRLTWPGGERKYRTASNSRYPENGGDAPHHQRAPRGTATASRLNAETSFKARRKTSRCQAL